MEPGALCPTTTRTARRSSCASCAPRASMVARSTTGAEAGFWRAVGPRRLPVATGVSRFSLPLGDAAVSTTSTALSVGVVVWAGTEREASAQVANTPQHEGERGRRGEPAAWREEEYERDMKTLLS